MLRTGIVGISGSKEYIEFIEGHKGFSLVGIYDPGFQTELINSKYLFKIYHQYHEFLFDCDVIFFATTEKLAFPLIESALKASKSLFLKGCSEFSMEELQHLQKLNNEAGEIFQIQHKFHKHPAMVLFGENLKSPTIIEIDKTVSDVQNIMPHLRAQISLVLMCHKSNLKRAIVNSATVFNQMPDVINLRLDFDNGTVAKIIVSAADCDQRHTIKVYDYNQVHYIDIDNGTYHLNEGSVEKKTLLCKKAFTSESQLNLQIEEFYSNIICFSSPTSSIQIELQTQKVIEKVKEKLKVCFSFF